MLVGLELVVQQWAEAVRLDMHQMVVMALLIMVTGRTVMVQLWHQPRRALAEAVLVAVVVLGLTTLVAGVVA
jgi:uncharacterized membrane protein